MTSPRLIADIAGSVVFYCFAAWLLLALFGRAPRFRAFGTNIPASKVSHACMAFLFLYAPTCLLAQHLGYELGRSWVWGTVFLILAMDVILGVLSTQYRGK